MNSIWFLWDIFINILEYLILYILLKQKLGFVENKKLQIILATVALIIIQSFMNYSEISYRITMAVMYAISIIYALIFFKGTAAMRVMWCSAVNSVYMLSGMLVSLIMVNISFIDTQTALYPSIARMFPTSIYIIICFLLLGILMKFPKTNMSLPRSIQAVIIFVSISCCILGGQMQYMINMSEDSDSVYVFAIMALSVFLLCFFYIIHKTGEFFFKDAEYRNQIRSMEIEAKNNEQMQTIISSWNHDQHHHIAALSAFACNNDIDKIRQYLRQMQVDLEESTTMISTGNPALDAILTKTFRICHSENIRFKSNVKSVGVLPISDTEISSLIGNMLDNAVDACKAYKKDNVDPFIDIYIYRRQKMIVISVSNSSTGIYEYEEYELKSTKDKKKHGYGLKRIKQIAEKANGFVHIEPASTVFKIEVCIPDIDINGGKSVESEHSNNG